MTDEQLPQNLSSEARSATIAALRAQIDALSGSFSPSSSASSSALRRTVIEPASAKHSPAASDSTLEDSRSECSRADWAALGISRRLTDDGTSNSEKKAFDRIVALCGFSDYSRERMRLRLKREHVDERSAENALSRAVECGLIDDIRYGEALCAGRMRAGKGRSGIESELWENNIDPARIEGWPEEYEQRYGTDLDRALDLIERHPPRSKRPRDSAYRRLRGKGYSSETASKAAGIWWSRTQSETRSE